MAEVRLLPRPYWLIVLLGAVFTLARFSEAVLISPGVVLVNARLRDVILLREQLGLELQSRRAPVDLVVVESITLPTPD